MIRNKRNGKYYIGESRSMSQRLKKHRAALILGKHDNDYLQKAFQKYGLENFEFDVLEECEDRFLSSQEHYWCTILRAHDENYGYNIKPTSPIGRGHGRLYGEMKRRVTKALVNKTKDHIRKIQESKYATGAIARRSKRVIQIDRRTGEEIAIFQSMREAKRITGVERGPIKFVIEGKFHHAGGYFWKLDK